MKHYDCTVIGAGPAGITTAIELARRGWNVLLADKSKFPRAKVCGGFIGPENKPLLAHYNILDQMQADGNAHVTHIHLSAPNGQDVLVPLRYNGHPDHGLGFSRKRFDELLVIQAKKEGVTFLDQALVQVNKQNDFFSLNVRRQHDAQTFKSRYVVYTTGARPSSQKNSGRVFGVSALFDRCENLQNNVTMHFVDGGHMGINRFEHNAINVCYVIKERVFKKLNGNYQAIWNMFLKENKHIRDQLSTAKQLTSFKGTFVDLNTPLKFFDKDAFYAGDAAGIIHPVAGGGISMALNSGLLLGTLMGDHHPDQLDISKIAREYQTQWCTHYQRPVAISKWIGALGHNKYAANAIIRFLKYKEHSIDQLFDTFHQPAVFDQRSFQYECR